MSDNTKLIPKRRFKEFKDADAWEQRKVEDVLELLTDFDANGSFADMANNVNTYDSEGYAWYVRMTDLKNQSELSNLKYVDKESYDFLKKTALYGGELLMAKRGEIGNVYIFKARTPFATLAPNMYLLKLNKETIPEFMYGFFQADIGKNQLLKINASTTMGALYKDDVKNIDINIPNYDEQSKIAELFFHLDNLITLHQRKLDKLKDVKKSYLNLLFPAEGERKPKMRFKGFTDDWEQRELGDVCDIVAGGTPSTQNKKYWFPKEIPWLSSGEVHKKRIKFTDDLISEEGFNNSSAKWVESHSVLIALAGQGKTRGTVAINEIPLTTNQSIAAMIPTHLISCDYLFSNLEGRYEEIRMLSSADGSRGGLNKQMVSDITILMPNLDEQQKIGSYFKTLDALITLHQRKLDKLKDIKKAYLNEMFV